MSNSIKPRLAKGTRDFSPEEMALRNHIFDTIRKHFHLFGFEQIETPAVENLETLTGKYGDEGDKLIFKILNSGDYLNKASDEDLNNRNSDRLIPQISEKALRYDLTVPFARYVVQHRNDINFPFRRYQVQPVWRADRPQKGRYREFFQCDADVIGSDSLMLESEFISLIDKVYKDLNINAIVKLNNRKILFGFCESNGVKDSFQDFTVILDKLDKKPWKDLVEDFKEVGFDDNLIKKAEHLTKLSGQTFDSQSIDAITQLVERSEVGLKGIDELKQIFSNLKLFNIEFIEVQLDLTLARGLNYYTGAIIEVVARDHEIGSICGGGRYDDLTGIFGMPDVSGIGISFGIDRIFDILKNQGWKSEEESAAVMLVHFGADSLNYNLEMLQELRGNGLPALLYPDNDKLKKQFKYADQRQFNFVLLAGNEEMEKNVFNIKNLKTGDQSEIARDKVLDYILNR